MTDPREICARMIDMASCLETFGGWPRIMAWNLGIAALLGVSQAERLRGKMRLAIEKVKRERAGRCRYDHDGDGNCHIHPGGCP